jgi:DNA-binding response OmpR family regulator
MKVKEQTKETWLSPSRRAEPAGKTALTHDVSGTDSPIETPPKILIVDDSPHVCRTLTIALTKSGYQAHAASDGKSALEWVIQERPDIILLDIIMPGLDGYEVCRTLKSDVRTSMIPVIFLSALEENADKVEGFKLGAADYIAKPFEITELLARLRVHLELKRLQRTLEVRNEELQQYAEKLEALNVTLKVLLTKREEDIAELEEKVLLNVKHLLIPHIDMLKRRKHDPDDKAIIDLLESNLKKITSTFSQKLSSKYLGLTPTEIKVANLVKEGRQIKEIANMLSVSRYAIELHRFNIRRKLGLKNRKINLQAYLSSLT